MKYFNKIKFKNLKQAIFFDIESASIEPELKKNTPLLESWQYKMRNDKELDTFDKLNQSFKENAPLYSPFGRVCCISMGYAQDGKLKVKEYKGADEKEILEAFFADLLKLNQAGKTHLVSFSGNGYDCPFIFFRSIINGVNVHPMFDVGNQKEWGIEHSIDLNTFLRGTAFTNMSLLNVAVAMGLPSPKQSLKGDEVSSLYWSKTKDKFEKIGNYCTLDTLTTANIFCKILGEPILELEVQK